MFYCVFLIEYFIVVKFCRWMFPIGKRQEHIFIGFLLAKAQLSPDDYGNAHDDHDHDDISFNIFDF